MKNEAEVPTRNPTMVGTTSFLSRHYEVFCRRKGNVASRLLA